MYSRQAVGGVKSLPACPRMSLLTDMLEDFLLPPLPACCRHHVPVILRTESDNTHALHLDATHCFGISDTASLAMHT